MLTFMLRSMAVSVTVLASGSKGNCTLVSSSTTRLLIDAGISCREVLRRLQRCCEDPCAIDAILITHEHSDHIAGIRVLARKLKIPVYITGATYQAYQRSVRDANGHRVSLDRREHFSSGMRFQIGDISVTPFTIPHDAVDPVGFTFRATASRSASAPIWATCRPAFAIICVGCHVLMIESNHDLETAARRSLPLEREAAGDEPRRPSLQ